MARLEAEIGVIRFEGLVSGQPWCVVKRRIPKWCGSDQNVTFFTGDFEDCLLVRSLYQVLKGNAAFRVRAGSR